MAEGKPGPSPAVWFVLGDGADGDVLDADERARAARFRRAADAHAYVRAHVALRELVGRHLGIEPAAVRFGREPCPLCDGPHGRPTVLDAPGLHVSLSHVDAVAAVALADVPVGIDVEPAHRLGRGEAAVALHPRELARARATRSPLEAATLAWVRKEAYLKGTGHGLGVEPATVDVTDDPPGWRVVDLDAPVGHVGALAVRRPWSAEPVIRACIVDDLGPSAAGGG